jgi:hypothetical protein
LSTRHAGGPEDGCQFAYACKPKRPKLALVASLQLGMSASRSHSIARLGWGIVSFAVLQVIEPMVHGLERTYGSFATAW